MLAAALALALSAGPASAAPAIFGFNLVCWGSDCFGTPSGRQSLGQLAGTGARWLAVVQTRYMESKSAGAILPGTVAAEDEVRAEIKRAKGLGLKVALKPHVDVVDGTFRSKINPRDAESWWKDYDAYVLKYAALAAEEKCDLFVVGTELASLAQPLQERRWKSLIARVRAIYPGPLTYAANWYDYPAVPFWRDLDYVGVDGYFPIPQGQSRAALKIGWGLWKAGIAAQALAAGKPVLFTEFGISSQKGANMKPWEWNPIGPLDLELQKNYYETFLEAFGHERWFAGVLVWGWDIDPASGGSQSRGLTVQGKPALEVLEAFFARWSGKSPPPPPPAGMTVAQRAGLQKAAAAALREPAFR